MIFAPSLARLASADRCDFTEVTGVRKAWAKIFSEGFQNFDTFYSLILDAGETLSGRAPGTQRQHRFTRKTAGDFLFAASDTGYLHAIGSKPAIQIRLEQHNEAILSLIRQMTAAAKQRPELAPPVDSLISLYFHHVTEGDATKALCADVARLIPDALISFPEQSFPFAVFLLAKSADAAEQIGRIITFHLVERGVVTHDVCQEVAEGMMGLTGRPRDRLCELGPAIMGPVARNVRDRRPDIRDSLVAAFVLTPLACDPRSREAEVARLEADLLHLHFRLRRFEEQLKSPVPATAQDTPLVLDISRAKQRLECVKTDFKIWVNDRRDLAVRQIATQPTKRATLEAIQAGLMPLKSANLDALLSDAAKVAQD